MADYCKQCSQEIFQTDGDFVHLVTEDEETQGLVAVVLCEGCGPTSVNRAGECIYHKGRTAQECYADTVPKVKKDA